MNYYKNLSLESISYTSEEGLNLVEIFKDIPGYEGLYQVSSLGRVKSLDRNIYRKNNIKPVNKMSFIMKQKKEKSNDYLRISFRCKDHYLKSFSVHRLVALAFIPNPENKPQVNHINGIKTDNRVENLEWCTAKENTTHALNTGLRKNNIGENHKLVKLKEKDILEIRNIGNKISLSKIASIYNVDRTTIYKILKNKSWNHI